MDKLFIFGIVLILILTLFLSKSKFESTDSIKLVLSLYKNRFKDAFTLVKSNKLQSVDMVYAIAMPQRKEYITKQIKSMGLTCKFLDAVKPSDLTTAETDAISDVNKEGSYLYKLETRLAVLMSFTMCYIDALTNEYSTIMIFEDDIIIDVDLNTLDSATTEFVQSDNDIFYMGYCFLNCKQSMDTSKFKYIISLNDPSILCGHALCIKTKMLPSLIEYCFPMKKPSDELFTDYYHLKQIKACIPKKPYFNQITRDLLKSLNESTVELKLCR